MRVECYQTSTQALLFSLKLFKVVKDYKIFVQTNVKPKLSNRSWRTIALVSQSRTKGREVNTDLENVSQISGIAFSLSFTH